MLERRLERRRDQDGFTLIELMVVVLIIGILIAIALPTFLGARTRAQNRAAEANLRTALVAAKTMFSDSSSYASATSAAGGLVSVEPNLCYVAAATVAVSSGATCVTGSGNASISVAASAGQWSAAAMSASTQCFAVKDVTAGGTTYGQSSVAAALATTGCNGTQAGTSATAAAWV